ncbi:hypothetical protein TrST_g1029 [Triparma strigata]|uniref:Adaptor protein ClpS core domain-containing protein n=1 Tax=Triparma strigata TaxID=1606541 RepID=A0A9W6ZUY5_9STRA|nr:hypothetical protein TrST_g1029 [Triparma strigata]
MRPANVQPSFTRRNRPLFSSLGSGAVLEKPKTSTKKTTENSAKDSAGEWQVRLYNDPVNKREFVARCLMEVCGVNDGAAFQIMMNAHQNGAAVIGRYDFERAELYYTSLRDNGLTVDMVKVGDSD